MKIKSILLTALSCIAFACDNEDKVTPQQSSLLTIKVDASYRTDISDDWVIAHDGKGTLLAYEQFENNQEMELVTNKPVNGKIMVTYLNISTDYKGSKRTIARSYANIETGKTLLIKGYQSSSSQLKGKYNVTVSDVYNLDYYSLSPSSHGSSWSGGILDLESSLYTGDSKHILSVSSGNSLKYKVLTDVQPEGQYSFSFNDMISFERKVKFTYPQPNGIYLYIAGHEVGVQMPYPHVLMQRFQSNNPTSIEAGYIDPLTNYSTFLQLSYKNYSYYYTNIGSIPDPNILWPEPSDFSITAPGVNNFTATSSTPFIWRSSTWRYQGFNNNSQEVGVSWNIISSSASQAISEMPAEITSLHPELSFKNLNHEGTTFYTQSPEFNSIVNSNFNTESEPTGVRVGIDIRTN